MKKQLLTAVAAITLGFGAVSLCSAQSALFVYDDGNGVPNAGTYHPGDSFSFTISLIFTSGGSIANLDGVSYWLQQKTAGPFSFSITSRDSTGSAFSELQTDPLSYPQMLNPSNANDLGGAIPANQAPLGSGGPYFVATITVSIDPSAPITGTYVLDDVLTGGKTSVISDSMGHTFAIPEADYTITLVPEPATWVAGALILAALVFSQRHRFARVRKAT